jgi:cobalt-zinc-cadmium efflux system protein
MAHAHTHHAHSHHAHSHSAPGEPPDARTTRAFAVGVVLNFALVVAEVIYGFAAHSMALLADAGHNLGDVLGLLLAGGAALLARRRPTRRRTYGLRRITLLSALANGVVLLFGTGALAWESLRRLVGSEEGHAVHAMTVVVVAGAGVVVNGVSALLFLRGRHRDLNVKSAFLHLLGDAGIAFGVVVSSLVIARTGWAWLDPATSLVIALLILASTWSLLRRSMDLVLDAVPEGIDIELVREYLATLPRVSDVHDLHIWAMSTTETALTAHLRMPGNSCEPQFLTEVCRELHERFGIAHPTLQVDPEESPHPCRLAPSEVV